MAKVQVAVSSVYAGKGTACANSVSLRVWSRMAALVEEVVGRATAVEAVVTRRGTAVCAVASGAGAAVVVVEAGTAKLAASATSAAWVVIFVGAAVEAEYPDLFVVDEATGGQAG